MRISDWSSEVCSSDLLALIDSATPAILQHTAAHWLSGGDHTLVIEPSETALSRLPETPFANRESGATDDAVPTVDPKFTVEIGRASCGKACVSTCRYRWSPYH